MGVTSVAMLERTHWKVVVQVIDAQLCFDLASVHGDGLEHICAQVPKLTQ